MNKGEFQFELDLSSSLTNWDYSSNNFQVWIDKASVRDLMGDFYLRLIWADDKIERNLSIEIKSSTLKALTYANYNNVFRGRIQVSDIKPTRQCYIAVWIGDLSDGQWIIIPPVYINNIFLRAGRRTDYNRHLTFEKKVIDIGETLGLVTTSKNDLLEVVLAAMDRNDKRIVSNKFNRIENKFMQCAIW